MVYLASSSESKSCGSQLVRREVLNRKIIVSNYTGDKNFQKKKLVKALLMHTHRHEGNRGVVSSGL